MQIFPSFNTTKLSQESIEFSCDNNQYIFPLTRYAFKGCLSFYPNSDVPEPSDNEPTLLYVDNVGEYFWIHKNNDHINCIDVFTHSETYKNLDYVAQILKKKNIIKDEQTQLSLYINQQKNIDIKDKDFDIEIFKEKNLLTFHESNFFYFMNMNYSQTVKKEIINLFLQKLIILATVEGKRYKAISVVIKIFHYIKDYKETKTIFELFSKEELLQILNDNVCHFITQKQLDLEFLSLFNINFDDFSKYYQSLIILKDDADVDRKLIPQYEDYIESLECIKSIEHDTVFNKSFYNIPRFFPEIEFDDETKKQTSYLKTILDLAGYTDQEAKEKLGNIALSMSIPMLPKSAQTEQDPRLTLFFNNINISLREKQKILITLKNKASDEEYDRYLSNMSDIMMKVRHHLTDDVQKRPLF